MIAFTQTDDAAYNLGNALQELGELDEAIELIKAMRDRGVTIIIVEHIMKVIMTISNRIHAINYGQTIAEGCPEEVANNKEVIEAYLGEE